LPIIRLLPADARNVFCKENQSSSAAKAASRVFPDQSGLVLTRRDKLTAHACATQRSTTVRPRVTCRRPHWTTVNKNQTYTYYSNNFKVRTVNAVRAKCCRKNRNRNCRRTVYRERIIGKRSVHMQALGAATMKSKKQHLCDSHNIQSRTSVLPFMRHMQT
jgi:hypothetical protein